MLFIIFLGVPAFPRTFGGGSPAAVPARRRAFRYYSSLYLLRWTLRATSLHVVYCGCLCAVGYPLQSLTRGQDGQWKKRGFCAYCSRFLKAALGITGRNSRYWEEIPRHARNDGSHHVQRVGRRGGASTQQFGSISCRRVFQPFPLPHQCMSSFRRSKAAEESRCKKATPRAVGVKPE
jgi:hypothetical protein